MPDDPSFREAAERLSQGDREELLSAVHSALGLLVTLEAPVEEMLEHGHYLALVDAQQVLALAYAHAGGPQIEGVCLMCGRSLERLGGQGGICGYCERSYGPND